MPCEIAILLSFSDQQEKGILHRVCNFTGVLPFIDLAGRLLQFFNLAPGALFTFGSLNELAYLKRGR